MGASGLGGEGVGAIAPSAVGGLRMKKARGMRPLLRKTQDGLTKRRWNRTMEASVYEATMDEAKRDAEWKKMTKTKQGVAAAGCRCQWRKGSSDGMG